MADRPFTLIDLMTGMEVLSLNTYLTTPCFSFFWGLVMQANRLKPRFKNPFDLTVAQAIGIGGGDTRQAVNQKQHVLNKVTVDGQRLIWIKPGSRKNNTAAKYKINYDLILAASPVIIESTQQTSMFIDEQATNTLRTRDDPVDDHDPILRSEKKREEEIILSDDEKKYGWLIEQFQKADVQFRMVNDVQRQMVNDLLEYPEKQIEAVLQRAAEKGVQGSALITWAEKGLADYDRLYNAGANGLSDAKRDQIEREIRDMREELEITIKMDDPRNDPWIKQQRDRIEYRIELRGKV